MIAFADNAPADFCRRFAEGFEIRRCSNVNRVAEQMIGNKNASLDLFGDSFLDCVYRLLRIVSVGVKCR